MTIVDLGLGELGKVWEEVTLRLWGNISEVEWGCLWSCSTTILTILVSPPGYQGWDLSLEIDLLVLGPGSMKIKEATMLRGPHLRDRAGK